MTQKFGGVWPAMLTPLDEAGRPALEQIDQLIELFIEQRLGGLYILGSTGQGLLLSREERMAVAARIVKQNAGRLPVIVHVGANTTDEAIHLARHACEIGADAISSVGPVYYPLPADDIFEHYDRIGAAGDLPFFVYQIDVVNQPKIPLQQYVARVLEIPNIAGMKITSSDLYQFGLVHRNGRGRLTLFSGTDQLFCHALLSGAAGAIGTFYNLWGPECRAAREALLAGKVVAASRFMLAFQQVTYEAHMIGIWPFLRAAMQCRYNLDIGPMRAPLAQVVKPVDETRLVQSLEAIEKAGHEIE